MYAHRKRSDYALAARITNQRAAAEQQVRWSDMSLSRQFHLWLLSALLLIYSGVAVYVAVRDSLWDYLAGALLAFISAVGAIFRQRWSGFLVIILGTLLVAQWCWLAWFAIRTGALPHRPIKTIISFLPATLIMLIVGYCCFIAWRYLVRANGHLTTRSRRP